MIIFKIVTLFSPLRIFLPISAASFLLGVGYGIWNVVDARAHPQRIGAADPVRGRRLSRRARVRADFGAALRRPAVSTARTTRTVLIVACVLLGLALRLGVRAALLGRPAADARRARVPGARRAAWRAATDSAIPPTSRRRARASSSAARPAIRCSSRRSASRAPSDHAPRRVQIAQACVGAVGIWLIGVDRAAARPAIAPRSSAAADRRRLPAARVDAGVRPERNALLDPRPRARADAAKRGTVPVSRKPGQSRFPRNSGLAPFSPGRPDRRRASSSGRRWCSFCHSLALWMAAQTRVRLAAAIAGSSARAVRRRRGRSATTASTDAGSRSRPKAASPSGPAIIRSRVGDGDLAANLDHQARRARRSAPRIPDSRPNSSSRSTTATRSRGSGASRRRGSRWWRARRSTRSCRSVRPMRYTRRDTSSASVVPYLLVLPAAICGRAGAGARARRDRRQSRRRSG